MLSQPGRPHHVTNVVTGAPLPFGLQWPGWWAGAQRVAVALHWGDKKMRRQLQLPPSLPSEHTSLIDHGSRTTRQETCAHELRTVSLASPRLPPARRQLG